MICAASPAAWPPAPAEPSGAAAEGHPGESPETEPDAATPPRSGGSGGAGPADGARTHCESCGVPLGQGDRFCEACGHRQPDPADHVELRLPLLAAVTDRGLRHQHNEDAVVLARLCADADAVTARLAVVCDGVSSGPRPELASSVAARTGANIIAAALRRGAAPDAATREGISAAQDAVAALAAGPSMSGSPACTFVSALEIDGAVTVGWVGDSRAYWLPEPDGRGEPAAELLTEDDSWVVATVASGIMSRERAEADRRAHALVGWLGADAQQLRPRTTTLSPDGPGTLLLCSDGLWNYLADPAKLAGAVRTAMDASAAGDFASFAGEPLPVAGALVDHALRAGGRDNVTVALMPMAERGRAGDADRAPGRRVS